jgi:peptidoglycan/LPS O-acetylase OafA/YrhL
MHKLWSGISGWFLSLPEIIGRPQSSIAYIPQLDGLRALAILLVLIWHSSLRAARYVDDLHASGVPARSFYFFFPHGEIGVALFFFVSGFVIAKPFLAGKVPDAVRFYLRRLRRIYPPYLFIIVITFLLLGPLNFNPGHVSAYQPGEVSKLHSFLLSLVYLHSLVLDTSSRLLPPAWSLEVEMQFYLLAPLFLRWYSRRNPASRARLLGILVVLSLLLVACVESVYNFDGRYRLGLLKHLDLFLAGILTADLLPSNLRNAATRYGDWIFCLSTALLIGIGIWLTNVDGHPTAGFWSLLADTSLLLAVTGICYGAMRGKTIAKLLSWHWLCLIGTMCYSIYLIHIPLMQAFSEKVLRHSNLRNPLIIWPLWILVLTLVSLIAAAFYYTLIERPFMGSPKPRQAPVAADREGAPALGASARLDNAS